MKPKVIVLRGINQSPKEERHGLGCLGFFFLLYKMSGEHKGKEWTLRDVGEERGRQERVMPKSSRPGQVRLHTCAVTYVYARVAVRPPALRD